MASNGRRKAKKRLAAYLRATGRAVQAIGAYYGSARHERDLDVPGVNDTIQRQLDEMIREERERQAAATAPVLNLLLTDAEAAEARQVIGDGDTLLVKVEGQGYALGELPPSSGKSAALAEFVAKAEAQGVHVVYAPPMEPQVPTTEPLKHVAQELVAFTFTKEEAEQFERERLGTFPPPAPPAADAAGAVACGEGGGPLFLCSNCGAMTDARGDGHLTPDRTGYTCTKPGCPNCHGEGLA